MNQPIVSVILPLYNVAPYLPQCIDSILSQTLSDFELICIDDGSTDGSADILDHYAQQDNRIHVLHQQNQNAGVARNRGVEAAQGEYVIFLDSDDFFSPELLERTYQSAQEYQADIVLFGGVRYDEKNKEFLEPPMFLYRDMLPDKAVFSWKDIPADIFSVSSPAPWCKLYNHQFLIDTGLQFQDLSNANDFYFTLSTMALAQRITTADGNLIYYRSNRSNNLQSVKDSNPLCFLSAIEALYQELLQHKLFDPLQTAFRQQALSTIVSNLQTVKTDAARLQILEALDKAPYCDLPLKEIPEIDGNNEMVHYHYVQFTAAQEQYHQSLHAEILKKQWEDIVQKEPESEKDNIAKVSVIVPAYNTEDFLEGALTSIAEQTLTDLEIICINDGSNDDSLDILNRWVAGDNRFTVLSQPNSGLGFARNVGILQAHGEYLYFMDSDDILDKEALEQLVAVMDEKQLDILYFDGEPFCESAELEEAYTTYKEYYHREHSFNDVYNGPTLMRLFIEDNAYLQSACLQMFRTSFLKSHNLFFPVGVTHEDNAFTFAALLHAQRTSHVGRAYFHRRIRSDSIMTNGISFRSVYGRYKAYWEMLGIYHEVSASLPAEDQYAARNIISIALRRAQDDYAEMAFDYETSELGLVESLPLFRALIGKQIKDYREQINNLEEWNHLLAEEPDRIHASISYRLGRALTSPARWLRGDIKKERQQ